MEVRHNRMNYTIIQDKKALLEFIEWLPELEPHTKFYSCLLARSKYAVTTKLGKDKISLRRFTSDKRFLYRKISQLEVPVGSYTLDDLTINQECLALYITPNPRDLIKATKQSLKKFADLITQDYNGYNPHSEVLSAIQTSCGIKKYYDFDYDSVKIDDVKDEIESFINKDCLTYVETRGGFHLLVELGGIDSSHTKTWYKGLTSIKGVDVRGADSLLPVVGCCQGGYTPRFYNQS